MLRSLKGKTPTVHPTAFVSEAAYIVGDVEIGEYSSVWPGVVIRGDSGKITIGRHTNIQDNSVVHSDADARIGDGCTLGHSVTWHGRLLSGNCLVGNGAVVNDGVEVGEFSIIAAGSVVLEEARIPARSVVRGIPGKPAGQVEERHVQLIQSTAHHYSQRGQLYKGEGLEEKSPPFPTREGG
ncbi:MAG: gamma carbonic anhydrase family protein [Chloroflexi bacterium]|nr:gamma carbonic anhydrase family protein [Chloroflexota bacterium]